MKKIFLLLCVSVLLLTSCGVGNSSSDSDKKNTAKKENLAVFDDVIEQEQARTPTANVNPNGIKDKVIAGYQGWFSSPDDGNKASAWNHWNIKLTPGKDFGAGFDLYPDISEYDSNFLYNTDFANFGNGQKAALFSSYNKETVDKHFKWMQDYGIDCAAVQRFGSDITSATPHALTVMNNIKNAAEEFGRTFYLTYDVSGYSQGDMADRFINDFKTLNSKYPKPLESPAYLKEGGKPVVQIWGIAVSSNYKSDVEQAKKLVSWFKENGYYVIGGVGATWRDDNGDCLPGYSEVYSMFDMISPWHVGRFNTLEQTNAFYKNIISEDKAYCDSKKIDYMPVLFPGFSWANWYPGCSESDRNSMPRRAGKSFWTQAKNAYNLNCTSYYLAMFDEYDEATAFAKSATDSSMIPTDYWFLTNSVDGTWLSSDFYLRLAGAFNNIVKTKAPFPADVPIPYSQGPVYFRSSFEDGIDVKARANSGNISQNKNFDSEISIVDNEKAYLRKTSVKIDGSATSDSSYYMSAICNNLNIEVSDNLKIRYYKYAATSGGKDAILQIKFTDGTLLTDLISPKELSGGKSKEWTKISVNLSPAKGKTIQAIIISYSGGKSDVTAYFDDLMIYK